MSGLRAWAGSADAAPPDTGEDETILVAMARLDPDAFGPLYARYLGPVYRYYFARLGNREAAEDATSLVFVRALAALPRFKDGNFRSWLFTIAHNVVANSVRAARPQQPLDEATDVADREPTPEEAALAAVDSLVYLGTSAGTLLALDAATGQERWRFTTESRAIVSEARAIADGTVYVGSGDGNVYALDAATGAERWRAPVGSAYSAPVVVDGVVYVAHTTNFNERPYPAVADGLVVINGCACGGLHALAADSGQVLWTHTPSANGLYALDPATGAERWHRPPGVNPPPMYYPVHAMISASAIGEGVVYVVEADAALLAVDAASGEERWRHSLTDSAGVNMIARSAPAVVAGVVYVGAIDGRLHAVDALTGATRWVVPLGFWIASSPAGADGIVYVGTMDGEVHAVDAATGDSRWVFPVGSAVPGSPVVADGTVYVADAVGALLALADAPSNGNARASPDP